MTEFNIINQDATALLSNLEEASVDLIVSSPPYFMGKEYDRSTNVDDFIEAHDALLPLLLRVLRPGGSLCWQVGNHVTNGALIPLDALVFKSFYSPELILRNRIIWTFGHGTHSTRRLSGRHETVLWFSKGEQYYFDLNAIRIPQKYPGKRHYKGPRKGQYSGNPLGKNPGDVWDIPNVKANHIEKTAHPCQFPVALVQRLVRALCPPDGLVVDPFSGSGSAGVAALVEGRRFLGSEIDAGYCAIARQRLAEAAAGKAQYRPLELEIYQPSGKEAVAIMPDHFNRHLSER